MRWSTYWDGLGAVNDLVEFAARERDLAWRAGEHTAGQNWAFARASLADLGERLVQQAEVIAPLGEPVPWWVPRRLVRAWDAKARLCRVPWLRAAGQPEPVTHGYPFPVPRAAPMTPTLARARIIR